MRNWYKSYNLASQDAVIQKIGILVGADARIQQPEATHTI